MSPMRAFNLDQFLVDPQSGEKLEVTSLERLQIINMHRLAYERVTIDFTLPTTVVFMKQPNEFCLVSLFLSSDQEKNVASDIIAIQAQRHGATSYGFVSEVWARPTDLETGITSKPEEKLFIHFSGANQFACWGYSMIRDQAGEVVSVELDDRLFHISPPKDSGRKSESGPTGRLQDLLNPVKVKAMPDLYIISLLSDPTLGGRIKTTEWSKTGENLGLLK